MEEAAAVGEKEDERLVENPRTGARVGKCC